MRHLSLTSKAILMVGLRPLLVTPVGVKNISSEELKNILDGRDQTFVSRGEVNDFHLLVMKQKMQLAYEAAMNFESNPDLKNYHQDVIQNADEQFEEIETTMSHLYRWPHVTLRGLSYGEALCEKIFISLLKKSHVLEIGCGTGMLAKNFLSHLKNKHPEIYHNIRYTMFDLSPGLQQSQKENCKEHLDKINFVQGDVHEFVFHDQFDVVIANEMIADLEMKVSNIKTPSSPPLYLVNTGAMAFVEKIKTLLKPNGLAFISEFGELDEYPVAVKLGGHVEHSIRFESLIETAHDIGLKTQFCTVGEYLEFEGEVEVLCRDSYALLSDLLLPYLGKKRLDRRPYTKEELKKELGDLYSEILNLQFYKIKEGKDLLSPYLFKALILKK